MKETIEEKIIGVIGAVSVASFLSGVLILIIGVLILFCLRITNIETGVGFSIYMIYVSWTLMTVGATVFACIFAYWIICWIICMILIRWYKFKKYT